MYYVLFPVGSIEYHVLPLFFYLVSDGTLFLDRMNLGG